jgi:diphosphomevalonate decarboxylase
MGKKGSDNFPLNSSLSYTLNQFKSRVEIKKISPMPGPHRWLPLETGFPMEMSEKGRTKYLAHFEKLLEHFDLPGSYEIRSGNFFPADCGLASSASSFAALTQAVGLLAEATHGDPIGPAELAHLSRQGSGSSCRSFFGPWALWEGHEVRPLEFPQGELVHRVLVTSAQKKSVSSSEAHKRVETSLLFQGRAERAEKRLAALIEAFKQDHWGKAFELCWAEFKDMHALFETAMPPFSYMNPSAEALLGYLLEFWDKRSDGPLVTMDAGPNIHLLFRKNQQALMQELELDLIGLKSKFGFRVMGGENRE